LSPDASHIVYDRPDAETRLRDIFIAATDGGVEEPLIQNAAAHDHSPAWTKDGRYVLFMSDRAGSDGLWAQRIEGMRAAGPPVRVEPNLGWAAAMGMTNAGAFFFRRQIGTRDLDIVDLDPTGTVVGEPVRVSRTTAGSNGSSDWSPDGSRLAFFRRRNDRWSLIVFSPADGQEQGFADP
jgi:Tol biopolymer transport system component